MYMKQTEKGTKKFTKKEKLHILEEAQRNGVKATLAKYNLYPGTYYSWKKKLIVYGEEGLDHKRIKDFQKVVSDLEKENEQLKLLIAEKELEAKIKDELLKKKYPELRKKKW